jgi:L-cysteine:1D-myo-inositol 2-amino-2-deoxy-alpha-D-glucopyranoside ligase
MKSWTLESQRIKSDSYPNSTLKIYDSRSKQVQNIDRANKTFQMYVCGITPYDSAHLGHAFTYLSFDLIVRTLNFIGISTNYVQNVTDIDDPLFERARKSSQRWQDIVNQQLDIYRKDMSALNILPPNHFVGVMENMGLITNQIGRTIDQNLS